SGVPVCIQCSNQPPKNRNVRNKLVRDLDEAVERADSASRTFSDIVGDIPSDLPHPDGAQRIHNATDNLSSARQKVTKAHSRLNDYLSRGIVPDDLKRSTD